jgi:hypothetical protein
MLELVIFAITNLATLAAAAALVVVSRRDAQVERAAHRAEVKALTDQLVLMKVDPPMAAVQAMPEPAAAPHISPFDDEALADYEAQHDRLQKETKALIEEFEISEAVAS